MEGRSIKPSDMLRFGMGLGISLSAKGFLGELGDRSRQDHQGEGMGILDDVNAQGKGIGTSERGAETSEKPLAIVSSMVKVK